jgi:hypothetical protein
MVLQHLDQTALAYPGFPTQQNDLPVPCFGLLPTFHQESDFGFATDQGCEASGLSHLKATGGTTLTEHVVEEHGLGDATQDVCSQVLTREIALH